MMIFQQPLPSLATALSLNDLARGRLAAGVDLVMPCVTCASGVDAPAWLQARLDRSDMDRLVDLRNVCIDHRIQVAQAMGAPTDFDKSRTDVLLWNVKVEDSQFYFFGQPESEGFIRSHMIGFDDLFAALSRPADVPGPADGFRWYGGALLCCEDPSALHDFFCMIEGEFPQLEARERELQMAQVLTERRSDAVASAKPPTPARRAARV
jgi:hypothetical protein